MNIKTTKKLITFELNLKHGNYESFLSIILEGSLTEIKKNKLFDLIVSNYIFQKLTYVNTQNPYIYNKIKHSYVCYFINSLCNGKTAYYYENDGIDENDFDIMDIDKCSYLYPIDYRIVVTDLSNIDKI